MTFQVSVKIQFINYNFCIKRRKFPVYFFHYFLAFFGKSVSCSQLLFQVGRYLNFFMNNHVNSVVAVSKKNPFCLAMFLAFCIQNFVQKFRHYVYNFYRYIMLELNFDFPSFLLKCTRKEHACRKVRNDINT